MYIKIVGRLKSIISIKITMIFVHRNYDNEIRDLQTQCE